MIFNDRRVLEPLEIFKELPKNQKGLELDSADMKLELKLSNLPIPNSRYSKFYQKTKADYPIKIVDNEPYREINGVLVPETMYLYGIIYRKLARKNKIHIELPEYTHPTFGYFGYFNGVLINLPLGSDILEYYHKNERLYYISNHFYVKNTLRTIEGKTGKIECIGYFIIYTNHKEQELRVPLFGIKINYIETDGYGNTYYIIPGGFMSYKPGKRAIIYSTNLPNSEPYIIYTKKLAGGILIRRFRDLIHIELDSYDSNFL
ncbi:MAG: hypothetical protein QW465_02590 [Candidatus Anstonellales archaeon]